jgi:hypothetical protein
MTRRGHLQSVPRPGYRCQIAAQAVMAGSQDMRVQAVGPAASPYPHGYIVIRVGRMLLYLEDREALASWREAMEQAEQYADKAFGPDLPPPTYAVKARARA